MWPQDEVVLPEEAGEHQVVEGDLEAVFDLRLGRALQVGDEGVERPVVPTLQSQHVHVASDQPAIGIT